MVPVYSWGRLKGVQHRLIYAPTWRTDINVNGWLQNQEEKLFPHGLGRSYGDSCLNEGGTLIQTPRLNRLISFDHDTGALACEAGASLAQILEFAAPRSWFLPVTPGTKHVTVGGAIANDVHGENHHVAGTFGRHVNRFELLRSDGRQLICPPMENSELFRATIGGLGLTGIITWAEIKLIKITSPLIEAESIKFSSLEEFLALSAQSASRYD